ncbi:glycosyltransferase family 4 protein [Antarctobacter sp.]|uniref:glycosyltransferase family 4 protein n=1 Tax=Antarctobacter sp. TaxID=1872577 RepID=UPI003A8FB3DC
MVLSVCETAKGGVGRFQDSLRAIEGAGFDLAVLLPEQDSDVLTYRDRIWTFRRQRRGVRALCAMISEFRRVRASIKPDVYFFNSTFALLPLLVMRMIGDRSPAVYCAHCWAVSNYRPGSVKGRIVRTVEGRLCGLADLVVNVSSGDADLARQLGYKGRHVVVENAVPDSAAMTEVAAFPAQAPGAVHLLFVGRFDRQKGLDLLLPAFARARVRNRHLHLHLVGGPVRSDRVPDLPDGVTWHGWAAPDQIDGYYRAADALVVPSRWEGLPLIVPEALRNGTPVLVADRSGMAGLVTPGETGAVFQHDADALTDCLARLTHPDLRAMRGAARASYEHRFTIDRFANQMAGHLENLVSR